MKSLFPIPAVPVVQFPSRCLRVRRRERGAAGGVLLVLIVLAVLVWWYWPGGQGQGPGPGAPSGVPVEPRPVLARGSLAEDEQNNIAVFRTASVSTVHITTLEAARNFFSLDVLQVPRGTGSGFLWDDRGHVVTNFHVIQGANAAHVTLSDQSNWKATLVGAFPDRDLAVLRIDAPKEKIKPISIGTSKDLVV